MELKQSGKEEKIKRKAIYKKKKHYLLANILEGGE
jgi:hypothetical protein